MFGVLLDPPEVVKHLNSLYVFFGNKILKTLGNFSNYFDYSNQPQLTLHTSRDFNILLA